jgi:hypothetical protein
MSKPPKRYWSSLVRAVFPKAELPLHDPNRYIGRTILAVKEEGAEPEEVIIQDVKGCAGIGAEHLKKSFQINGQYLVSMFSFYTQLLDGRLPTPEETEEFELATDIVRIKDLNGKED